MFAWLKSLARPAPDPLLSVLAERGERWYAACLRITRDPALAEDAVQDALLKAWDKRALFRGESEMDTWIHRIAINAAIDRMRRERPTLDVSTQDAADADAAEPHAVHSRQQLGDGLQAALTRLTDLERIAFVLKHLEEWRLAEIALELKTSQDSIKQALFRAVRKLRAALDPWRSDP